MQTVRCEIGKPFGGCSVAPWVPGTSPGKTEEGALSVEFRRSDKRVQCRSVAQEAEDCALLGFLDFLERDIAGHPERLQRVPTALIQRTSELVQNLDFDLDAAL